MSKQAWKVDPWLDSFVFSLLPVPIQGQALQQEALSNIAMHALAHWSCLPNEIELSTDSALEHYIDHISPMHPLNPDPLNPDPLIFLPIYTPNCYFGDLDAPFWCLG